MNPREVFKTKAEFAREIGLSLRTLYRRLKNLSYPLRRELLSPKEQREIYRLLNDGCDHETPGERAEE